MRLDGDRVVITADNGRWIYEVIDRDDTTKMITARWPD